MQGRKRHPKKKKKNSVQERKRVKIYIYIYIYIYESVQGRKRAWKCNKIQYFALAFLLPCTATLLQVATLAKTKATQLHLKKKTKNMLTNQLNIFKIQPTTSKEHNLILIVLTSMNP